MTKEECDVTSSTNLITFYITNLFIYVLRLCIYVFTDLFHFLFLQDDSPVVREQLYQQLAPEIESPQDSADLDASRASTSAKRHTFAKVCTW